MDAPRTIVAVIGEDTRYDALRQRAEDRALADHATLILYDLDAGRDPLESPLPTDWSAEGTEEAVADRLGPDELEAAGRHAVADQVRAARERGLDAWGWLPAHADKDTLSAYADDLTDPLILVPDDEPDLHDAVDVEAEVVGVSGPRSN
ncbi:MAG TPA: hypothetical protein VGJ17_05690 [Candidatus Limnocylindrales bacterium]|jgi:hypothetical protein